MAFWRVSTNAIRNLELALAHHVWGAAREADLRRLEVGDQLVFSCSRGDVSGYWALGTVTSRVHTSDAEIWPDQPYPFRIGFAADLVLTKPLKMEPVREVLRQVGLRVTYPPQSVNSLSSPEFQVISRLVRKASRGSSGV